MFTKREKQIVELVCQGMLNKQIAYKLGMARTTVTNHLSEIFKKEGVTTRTQLVIKLLGKEVEDALQLRPK